MGRVPPLYPLTRTRARQSRATRSASRPTRSSRLGGASAISFSTVLLRDFPSDVGQQSDPQSDRPAGAAWPPSPVPEFGLGLVRPPRRRIRWCGRRRRASAARYGVDFDTTPIEIALNWGGARSSSLSIDSRARGRQRDPLGPPPAIIGNKATANQSPLLRLVDEESHSKRTSTRQQLDCAKTL